RQADAQMLMQRGEVAVVLAGHGRHPGATFLAGNADTIDIGLADARNLADDFGDFRGRYILAFPAEGVTDAVDKIKIAVGVTAHQVAGAEPGVAALEHVVQDFGLVLCLRRVTLEAVTGPRRIVDDLADHFAGFVRRAALAQAVGAADNLVALDIVAHDRDRE